MRFTRTAAAALALSSILLCASARAGTYHVYSCRMPDGQPAPADGWSGAKTGSFTYVEDTCQQPAGALLAALGDQASRTANTDVAGWSFSAPSGARISSATLWRAGDADGGAAVNAIYEAWFSGPANLDNPANAFDVCAGGATCPAGVGNPADPMGPQNRVAVPSQNLGTQLFMNASCVGESGFKCKENQGDSNGYAAVVYLYAADITLEQAAGPAAGSVGGELGTAPAVGGTSDLTFTASDPGSGVYEALITLDGQLVQRTVLDENGGRCKDVGETGDGSPAFLYVQPCLTSVSADVALDTTRFANGLHHLVVDVVDAAGNGAPVLDRNVMIANAIPVQAAVGAALAAGAGGLAATLPGAPNGTNASSQATLLVGWKGARGSTLFAGYGHAETVTGVLTAANGAPISAARVEVTATPSYTGARSAAIAGVVTGADGRFTLRLPDGVSSRRLAFAYRARVGDPVPAATAALALVVRARVRLTISPRTASVGRRIVFRGTLAGRPVGAAGPLVVLEARSPGGSWIKFDVVHSNRSGHYSSSYRFRFPGPATYLFRAVSEQDAGYPFAPSASNVVTVHER